MADDYTADMASYRIQLRQVEAALSLDPCNEDLIQLKNDLTSVIEITTQLLSAERQGVDVGSTDGAAHKGVGSDGSSVKESFIKEECGAMNSSLHPPKSWKVGEKCLAPFSRDGSMREGSIVSIDMRTSQCSVYFESMDHNEIVHLQTLVRLSSGGTKSTDGSVKRMTKAELNKIKEAKKRKLQKKQNRLKIQEESQERIKHSWQSFNHKIGSRSQVKGVVKKSIFSTPDSINGKVGVGTCGIGGKPMTKFEANYFHLQKK